MSQANTHVVDIPHFCITHAIAMDGEGRTRNKNGTEQFGKKFNTIFRLSGSTLGAPFGSTLFSHTLYFITYFLFLKQNTENAENAARIFPFFWFVFAKWFSVKREILLVSNKNGLLKNDAKDAQMVLQT